MNIYGIFVHSKCTSTGEQLRHPLLADFKQHEECKQHPAFHILPPSETSQSSGKFLSWRARPPFCATKMPPRGSSYGLIQRFFLDLSSTVRDDSKVHRGMRVRIIKQRARISREPSSSSFSRSFIRALVRPPRPQSRDAARRNSTRYHEIPWRTQAFASSKVRAGRIPRDLASFAIKSKPLKRRTGQMISAAGEATTEQVRF